MQFIFPYSLGPLSLGGWQNFDFSLAQGLPENTVGVAIYAYNPDTIDRPVGWRAPGESVFITGTLPAGCMTMGFCGTAGGETVDIYSDDLPSIQYTLVGVFVSNEGAVFFSPTEAYTPAAGDTWETDTVTGAASWSTSAAIVTFAGPLAKYRLPGNSWNANGGTGGITGAIIPMNAAREIEYQCASGYSIYVHGILTANYAQWQSTVSDYGQTQLNEWYSVYPQNQPASGTWAVAVQQRVSVNSGVGIAPFGGSPQLSEFYNPPSFGGSGGSSFFIEEIFDQQVRVKYGNSNSYRAEVGYIRIGEAPANTLQGVERGRSMVRGFARGMR